MKSRVLLLHMDHPAFQPPETEFSNESYFKLDVWSSGVVLFMMTIGYFPFGDNRNSSPLEIFQNISIAKYSIPDNFDDCLLVDLFSKIFQIDPNLRFSCNQVSKHCWMTSKSITSKVDESNELELLISQSPTIFTPENIELIMDYIRTFNEDDVDQYSKNKESCKLM